MPAEHAKSFIDQVNQDPDLQKELQEAKAKLVEIAQGKGYNFTQDELHDELRRRWDVSKSKDDPETCTMA